MHVAQSVSGYWKHMHRRIRPHVFGRVTQNRTRTLWSRTKVGFAFLTPTGGVHAALFMAFVAMPALAGRRPARPHTGSMGN